MIIQKPTEIKQCVQLAQKGSALHRANTIGYVLEGVREAKDHSTDYSIGKQVNKEDNTCYLLSVCHVLALLIYRISLYSQDKNLTGS